MSDKRAQGRPSRGADEVGRTRIVDATRSFMRSGSAQEIRRKDLASSIGVTPALISYYFPQRTTLIELATLPVLSIYHDRLQGIGQSTEPPATRLKALIATLVDMNRNDARLIDYFETYVVTSGDYRGLPYVDLMRRQVLSILEAYTQDKPEPGLDAACLALAVWTLCKAVTHESLVRAATSTGDGTPHHALAAQVYAFVAAGIGARPSPLED